MKTKSNFIDNGSTSRFIHWLICTAILIACSEAMPQTSRSCETELKTAEQKYLDGYLDEAVDLLNRCLDKPGATNQDSTEAYKLLGKIYIAKENRAEAKKAFWMMLTINPAANLNPAIETSEVMSIFNEVKTALEKQRQPPEEPQPMKQGRSKKWLWIGGGTAVVAASITAIVLSNGTTDEGFVKPPGRPR